ncbi:3-hydroxyacyl-ACP dehydratase FabZ family protein [Streptomyces sp. MSC1_001]|uniref:3-hydroxyacyl-ACP dehydratase FabZ family protein n=1 Tax=Streptomyces sp. MSC1_001 TaxID=2909263 RepID=UPI00202EB72E|nr:beta-hydroxyacyl-ACP dehydratase [Streptomyces sp. MSC1_001]
MKTPPEDPAPTLAGDPAPTLAGDPAPTPPGQPVAGPAPTDARITSVIPHRPPALLVDRVVAVEPGRRLVAHRTVAAGPGFHPGPARPGRDDDPSLPLGLLLESWAQAAVLLACWERPNPDVLKGNVALLAGVRDVRALAPVEPGAVLVHEVRVVRDLGDTVLTTGTTVVGDRTVLEVGQLTLALRPAESLDPAAGTTAKTTDERS